MARRRNGVEMIRDAGGVILVPRQDGVVFLRMRLHELGLDCSSRSLSRYLGNGTIPLSYRFAQRHEFFVVESGVAAVMQHMASVPAAMKAGGQERVSSASRGRDGRFEPDLFRVPPPLK